jgi:hypothetical protein
MTDNHDNHHDNPDDFVQAFITTPIRRTAGDPYGFEWLFLSWAWEGRFHNWEKALRSLAKTLRGLDRGGGP